MEDLRSRQQSLRPIDGLTIMKHEHEHEHEHENENEPEEFSLFWVFDLLVAIGLVTAVLILVSIITTLAQVIAPLFA